MSSFGQELDDVVMIDCSGGWKQCGQKQKSTLANEMTPTKTCCSEEKIFGDTADYLLSLVHTRHLSAAVYLQNKLDVESQNNITALGTKISLYRLSF
eukprot:4594455-Ditylum_brightwellii.AAC.1